MFRRILLPVDGSLSMTPLVHQALAFAAGIQADVLAIHVLEPDGTGDTAAHADRILQEVAEAARARAVHCDGRVLHGAEPWKAIIRAAEEYETDLICMGSHGRHGATEHRLASQAARVLEHTRLPVLLFR